MRAVPRGVLLQRTVSGAGVVRSQIRVRGVTGDGREIHDVLIPVPLVTRTGTNGDMVNTYRRQQKMAI